MMGKKGPDLGMKGSGATTLDSVEATLDSGEEGSNEATPDLSTEGWRNGGAEGPLDGEIHGCCRD
jgi:hypothetical protein